MSDGDAVIRAIRELLQASGHDAQAQLSTTYAKHLLNLREWSVFVARIHQDGHREEFNVLVFALERTVTTKDEDPHVVRAAEWMLRSLTQYRQEAFDDGTEAGPGDRKSRATDGGTDAAH